MNQRSGHEAPSAHDTGIGEHERGLGAPARVMLAVLAYLVGFLLLDFATEGIQGTLQVSLWFPPAGLTFAFLLAFGWRFAAAVAPAFFLHLVLFRGGLGYPLATLLLLPVVYAAVYAGAAALLLRVARIDPRLPRMRDVAWFVGVACLLAPALVAAPAVWGFVVGGYATAGTFREDLLGFWAGDATGIAVLAPLLLVAARPFPSLWAGLSGRRRGLEAGEAAGFRVPSRQELPEALSQVLVLALVPAAAYGMSRGVSLDYAYLTFAPVVWIALRGGFERTVLALLVANVGVVVLAGQAAGGDDPSLLQFGLMTLTLVGLILGSQRSEQERTERALRSSERRFRTIVQNSSEVIEVCDPDGTLRYASPSHQDLFGYAPERAVGTSVLDRVHPDDLPSVLEETERATNGEGKADSVAEYRVRHADGSWRWVESVGTYLVEDPAVGGVVVNVRDVTERKASEEALKESEKRFRSLVQNSSDVITILDADGTIRYESPSVDRVLGYSPEEPVGEQVFDYVHPEDRERVYARFAGLVEEGGVLLDPTGFRFRHADGSWRYLEAVGSNLLDDPTVGGVVVTSRDITESKEAEVALEESEERYRAVVELSVETIYIYDAGTKRVLESNEAFREMMGYTAEELLGMEIYEFIAHDREDIDWRISRSLKVKGRHIGERNYRRKDGSLVVVQTSSSVIPYGGRTAICAVSRDVTGLKEAREKLEESERRFRSMIQNAPDAVSVLDADSTVRYDSPAIERLLGYAPEERIGSKGVDYVHPEDREAAWRTLSEVLDNPGVRLPVEYRLRHKDGSWRYFEAARTNLLDDPAVGGIVLNYRDITERKRTEEALRRSERHFRTVVESLGEGLLMTDLDDVVLDVNSRMAELTGYTREEMIGQTAYALFLSPDAQRAAVERNGRRARGVRERYESRLLRKDGTAFWGQIHAVPYHDPDGGEVIGTIGAVADVTERREAEEALRESEVRHRRQARELSLLHQARTILARELDPSAVFRAVVEAVADTYGYVLVSAYLLEGGTRRGTLILQRQVGYRTVIERVPTSEGVMGRVARTGRSVLLEDAQADPEFLGAIEDIVSEVCVPLFDGDEVVGTLNVESTGGEVLNEDDLRLLEAVGEHAGMALAQARLHGRIREAEQRYRALVENVPAVVYIDDVDETNSVIYRSPYVRDVLGYEPEDFLSDPEFWQKLLHPEDRERVLAENERTNLTGEPFRIEYRMIRKDGHPVWLRDEAVLIRDEDGSPRFWQGYFVDVTERKESERRLREAEASYRTMVEEVPAITYVHAQEPGGTSSTRYISPQIETVLGYAPEEYMEDPGFWKSVLHPDDRERVIAEDERTGETGKPFRLEFRKIAKDGRTVWLREEGRLVSQEEDGPQIWHGVMFDISELKRAGEVLRESEERFRALVQNASDMISILNPDGTIRYISPSVERVLGHDPEERIGVDVFGEDTHPDDIQRVLDAFARGLGRPGGVSEPLEFRVRHKDGLWRHLEAVAANRLDHPSVRGIVVNARDVTERKRAEEELQRERNLLRTVMDSAQDAVFVKDTEHRFVLNNRAHQRILGAESQEDLLGKTNADYWGEERAAPHHADDRRVIDAGEIILGKEEQIDHAGSGERRWISTTKVPLRGPDDSIEGLVAVSRDVTERRRAEEALRESEERHRAVMEQSTEAIWLFDPDTKRVLESNAAFRELLGYSEEELRGMTNYDFVAHSREDVDAAVARKVGEGKYGVADERKYRRKDGTILDVEVRGTSISYRGGEVACSVARDVTERKKAEESLRRSEDRFRQLFEQSADTILLHDQQGRVVDCNEEACRSLGYSKEELLGMTVRDFVVEGLLTEEERRARGADAPWRRAAAGEPGEVVGHHRGRHRRKDGTTFPVEVAVGSMEYGGRRLILASCRDVTKRERAETALRESEERFRGAFEDASTGMALVGLDNRYLRVNRALCEILGYSEEELLSESSYGLTHPEDLGKSRRRTAALLAEDGPGASSLEKRYVRKGGEVVWAISDVSLVYDPEGEPSHFVSQLQDITPRKQAEEALQESEERFRQLFEQSVEALLVHDERGRYVDCNAQACRLYGYSREELLNLSVSDLSCEMLTADERVQREGEGGTPWQRALSGEPGVFSFGFEEENRRKDGTTFPVEVRLGSVDYGGRRLMLVAARDVTERRRSEEEIREANRRLSDLAVLKADFTAMVAHELDSPLAVIRGYADILAAGLGDLEPGVRERALSRIRSETETLDSLVADVRSAASSERSDFDVEPGPVPLGGLLSDAADFAETLPGGHRLRVVPGVGEGKMVLADRERVGQVLRNLLSNAAKYSPEGAPVELRTSRSENPGRVRVEVADRGPGINPEDMRRIFEKFGRGRGAAGRKVGGLGLGLYLSRRIIRAHGGELTVDAGPRGDGSVFGFDLEAADE